MDGFANARGKREQMSGTNKPLNDGQAISMRKKNICTALSRKGCSATPYIESGMWYHTIYDSVCSWGPATRRENSITTTVIHPPSSVEEQDTDTVENIHSTTVYVAKHSRGCC